MGGDDLGALPTFRCLTTFLISYFREGFGANPSSRYFNSLVVGASESGMCSFRQTQRFSPECSPLINRNIQLSHIKFRNSRFVLYMIQAFPSRGRKIYCATSKLPTVTFYRVLLNLTVSSEPAFHILGLVCESRISPDLYGSNMRMAVDHGEFH